MSIHNIDTLQAYDELVAAGIPEYAARVHIRSMGNFVTGLATKSDLDNAIDKLEQHLKMYMFYIVGGGVTVGILIPVVLKIIGVI